MDAVEFESDVFGDAKRAREAGGNARDLSGALLETKCPACDFTGGALIIDGPDPVFVEVQCPRDMCGHIWAERVS